MYLDLEVERPGLRWSFLIGGLEGARGCGMVTASETSNVMEIFQIAQEPHKCMIQSKQGQQVSVHGR
ncbi:hypothetical protein TNCV_4143691 [Trichonephila clavipes]|nr:hypothetical protein TNCV_4143691 [Trichonephila clavipes]